MNGLAAYIVRMSPSDACNWVDQRPMTPSAGGAVTIRTTARERFEAEAMPHLNDLYRYEIRRLRSRLLRGEVRREDYVDHVLVLRGRYMLLSMPIGEWTVD